jgi:putative sterol carrier protein
MADEPDTPKIDTSAVDPEEFVRNVASTPDEQLAELMAGDLRPVVLDGIFERMAEHFKAESAAGIDAVVDWKILDRPDGGYDHYQAVISGGSCEVSKEPQKEPNVTLKVGPVDFLKLVTGNASGPLLFTTGKLKIEGDILLSARLPQLFRVPQAEGDSGE